MAKSKSGGTRSYIRGRVGADVYSIGRDSKGNKQQVVRSLAESVANPQTQAQMRGRMIMYTVMQALAGLKPIVDHSFDNVVGKQPNISEFIKRNYALIKADVAAHPSTGNTFGLNQYQEAGAKQGAYIISDGKAVIPTPMVLAAATAALSITLDSNNLTLAGLRSKLGLGTEEYFTLVGITSTGAVNYERFRINPDLADNVAITSENVGTVFVTEGNAQATVALASNVINVTLSAIANCCAVIITKKTDAGFIHSKAVLGSVTSATWSANSALPTYPVGTENFLNGGDIFGATGTDTGSNGGGSSSGGGNSGGGGGGFDSGS